MQNIIKQLEAIDNGQDLENLMGAPLYIDISGRGGGVGFYAETVANFFDVCSGDLPNKFGAGCNYLGGGVRGSIFASGFSSRIKGIKAKQLRALAQACVRVYKAIEDEENMNEEEDEDGINWDAMATNSVRKAGTISAY